MTDVSGEKNTYKRILFKNLYVNSTILYLQLLQVEPNKAHFHSDTNLVLTTRHTH